MAKKTKDKTIGSSKSSSHALLPKKIKKHISKELRTSKKKYNHEKKKNDNEEEEEENIFSNQYDLDKSKSNFIDEEIDEELAFGEEDEDLKKMFDGKTFKNNEEEEDLPDTLSDNEDTMELSAMLDEQSDEEVTFKNSNNKKISLLPESNNFDDELYANLDEDNSEDEEANEKLAQSIHKLAASASNNVLKRKLDSALTPHTSSTLINNGAKLTLSDLTASLDPKIKKSMKSLQNSNLTATLLPSLPSSEANKIARVVNYEHSVKEISKWQDIVKINREAEHLSFPLIQPNTKLNTNSTANFVPSSSLEKDMEGLLHHYGMKEDKLLEAQQLEMKNLSPEEVKKRYDELVKMKNLLFHTEEKLRRSNKIKSKAYRRIHRKEKEREMEGKEDHDEMLKIERERAEERFSLKHANTSRWVKTRLRRKQIDEDAQKAIQEDLRKGQSLKRKQMGLQSNGSDSEDFSGSEGELDEKDIEEDTINDSKKGLFNLKFMVKAEEKKANQLKEMREERAQMAAEELEDNFYEPQEEDEGIIAKKPKLTNVSVSANNSNIGRKSFVAKNAPIAPSVEGSVELLSNTIQTKESGISMGIKTKTSKILVPVNKKTSFSEVNANLFEHVEFEDIPESNAKLAPAATAVQSFNIPTKIISDITKKPVDTSNITVWTNDGPKNIASKSASITLNTSKTLISKDSKGLDFNIDSSSQNELISMAFSTENEKDEIQKEKEAVVEGSMKKVEAVVPGWGFWSGNGAKIPGFVKRKQKLAEKKYEADKKTALSERPDAHLSHVIINQERDTKFAKYLVKDLPFPYTTASQFEFMQKQPIGPDWNTHTTHTKLIQPAISTKIGHIIQPISRAALKDLDNQVKSIVGNKKDIAKNRKGIN